MLEKDSVHQDTYQNNDIDLRYLLGVLVDAKKTLIAIIMIGFTLGACYTWNATAIYKADALLQLEKGIGDNFLGGLDSLTLGHISPATTEIMLIKSRSVLGKTVSELGLDTVVDAKRWPLIGALLPKPAITISVPIFTVPDGRIGQPFALSISKNGHYQLRGVGISGEGEINKELTLSGISLLVTSQGIQSNADYVLTKISKFSAMENIGKNLTVAEIPKDSNMLQLSLLGANKELIRQILDSLSINYLQQNIDRKSESASRSLTFLQQQLPQIETQLETSEASLRQYRQLNESIDLPLEARAILESEVAVATQLDSLKFEEAELSKRYTSAHPVYRALAEKKKTLLATKTALDLKINGMPKTQQDILRLTRDMQTAQEMHKLLTGKQRELEIQKVSTVGNVHIVDSAQTLPAPVRPKKMMLLIISLLISVFIAVFFVLFKNMFKRGLSDSHQLETLGVKVYGSIPHSKLQMTEKRGKGRKDTLEKESLLALREPEELTVEAIRSLRTGLFFLLKEAKNKVMMVVGPTSGIGKSFVASNLAVVFAQSGLRVLLVDCDIRKGTLHRLFQLNQNKGLSELLAGKGDIKDCLYATDVAGLDLVPRGGAPENPSELLLTTYFAEFCRWASESYDVVLLDTPPLLAVSDAAIIGNYASTSLMVARFEVTSVKEIELAIKRLAQQGHCVTGVVLNSVVQRASQYFQHGHFEHYHYKSEAP